MLDAIACGQGDLDRIAYVGAQGGVFNSFDAAADANEGHLAIDHGGFQAIFYDLAGCHYGRGKCLTLCGAAAGRDKNGEGEYRGLLDYDDLLTRLRDLLREHPAIAQRLSSTLRYIMVDEYQDTNRLQAEIVRLLASSHDNVMAVGDDAQSIYSFRGAAVRNILEFPRLFPDAKIIKLEENYRSTQPILDLSNQIIQQAKESYTKNLFTKREKGVKPILVEAESENYQSRYVAQRILQLRERGVPLDEIAVLFRSSFHSFDLELELSRRGIPFVKRGGF